MKVTYKVWFGKPAAKAQRKKSPSVSRVARQLALAYHVERLIEDGVLKDYAEAARVLGITRARMTQVTNLLNLAPLESDRSEILAQSRSVEKGSPARRRVENAY